MTSPKTKKKKPYSPPPRAEPSASRQAANKNKCNKLDLELLMENTPDANKLPDLVLNQEQWETLNAITDNQMTTSLETDNFLSRNEANAEFKGVTNTLSTNLSTQVTPENTELQSETIALVTPENTELMHDTVHDTNDTITPTPVGHDTATTTDEEEAAEALLALSDLPDVDDEEHDSDDNANLMPIGGPSMSIDVNPVEVKLGADDNNHAIEQLPRESRLEAVPQTSQPSDKGDFIDTDPQSSAQQENSPPNSLTKGTLKVKNYDLKKLRQSNRTYRCQKCGRKERSVHDLNEHHRLSHPPLMCSECNKLFNVLSTFQLHMYDHQKKKKIPCETCGQLFSFQGQLDQHKIVHRTIKTHKCMAKDCGHWFMRKANLTVHAETHNKKEYKCDKCESFTT